MPAVTVGRGSGRNDWRICAALPCSCSWGARSLAVAADTLAVEVEGKTASSFSSLFGTVEGGGCSVAGDGGGCRDWRAASIRDMVACIAPMSLRSPAVSSLRAALLTDPFSLVGGSSGRAIL